MRIKKTVLILGILLLTLIIAGSAASQGITPIAQSSAPQIHLKAGSFTPSLGQTLDVPANLAAPAAQAVSGNVASYYIVQFGSPVTEADRASIEAAGGTIHGYIPDYAFKVKMTGSEAANIAALDNVIWTGAFQPAYRVSPQITLDGTRLYKIRIESGVSATAVTRRILSSGATIVSQDENLLVVAANEAQLNTIAFITDVAWVENFLMYEKHNEYGAGAIINANTANANGYNGSTQTVAVADTGFSTGVASTAHPDVPASRITAIQSFTAPNSGGCYTVISNGAQDVDSGHGTHVALSVLGDGDGSGVGRGTAPAANLVFQAVEEYVDFTGICALQYPDGYYLLGIPDNLTTLYQPAYNQGARVHSNSWGSDAAGDYTADSATSDAFIWNNRDMLITFSAGNEGIDANSNGVVDNDSIGSPATAKNVLTVGASENDRNGNWNCDTSLGYTTCASQGGQNSIFTYGSAWPSDFPAAPLFGDPSAGNAQQMGAFSSRGPTDDGRIKPDIVAPGTWILSGYSELYQQGYDASPNPQNGAWQYDGYGFPYNADYKYMSGTSMSNPIAAGAAAVVKDFYQKTASHNASAALTKATLINSATDLLDENNDGANDNDFPIPNVHEGWGLINLAAATDGSHQYVDNTTGISTGNSASYQFSLSSGGNPFKVTLVWSDYPSTEAASLNLVNNLNLTVTGPGGSPVYRGNVFSGGWSQTGGSFDTVNNVENVYVQSASAGTWTVQVSGANVPQGPQPFALVVDGTFGPAGPTNTPTNTPTASSTPTATSTSAPGSCTTYSSSDTPISLPNGTTSISSNIAVSGSGTIGDVNVSVNMPHAWPGDLIFTVAKSGTAVTIIDQPGVPASTFGCSTDNIVATLDDEASVSVESQCNSSPPAINGTFIPNNPLSAFDGQNGNGTWTLTVVDTYTSADAGSLAGWSVEICTAGAAPTNTPTSTSAPPTNTPTPTNTGVPPTNTPTPTNTSVPPTNTPTPTPTNTPSGGGTTIYVSSSSNGTAGGVSFQDEDILAYNVNSGTYSMYFDGSDVGLTSSAADVTSFSIRPDGSILLSFSGAVSIPNIGAVDDSDIVRFIPTSLGPNTSGTYEWYFDGSDVGLTTNAEDIDAFSILSNGNIVLSTTGSFSVSGASGADEDLVRFIPSSLGSNTSGSWAVYFDGSDVGLNNSSSEDVNGASVNESISSIYLTTLGAFSVSGVSGDGADIFRCNSVTTGSNTNCASFSMFWDGSANGFAGEVLDGFQVNN